MEHTEIHIYAAGPAFADDPATEIARILRDLADQFERDGDALATLRDANGEACGTITTRQEVRP